MKLHIVMMNKTSKFLHDDDNNNNVDNDNDDDLAITIAELFLPNRQVKNEKEPE